MKQFARKVIFNSTTPYSGKHDQILYDLIDAKVLLFCTVGTDCEMWHDIMDEILVGDGTIERDFDMITTSHTDETLEEVIDFANAYHVDSLDQTVQVVKVGATQL